jgi:hypothetical protein
MGTPLEHDIGVTLATLKAIEERVSADSAQLIGGDGGLVNPVVRARIGHAVQIYAAQQLARK